MVKCAMALFFRTSFEEQSNIWCKCTSMMRYNWEQHDTRIEVSYAAQGAYHMSQKGGFVKRFITTPPPTLPGANL